MPINCVAYQEGKLADGMNFEHMPELKWRYAYPLALGLITSACGLLYWRFRRAGWL
jgi:magnesium transporter